MKSAGLRNATPQGNRLFAIVVGVLVVVLLAVGYVQWRQYQLLDSAAHYQNDALGWSFSQLETEQLRLRNQLQLYLGDAQHQGADNKLQLRYDIFISRIGLIDHERAADIMRDQPGYAPALLQVRAFVTAADRALGPTPAQPLDAAFARELLGMLDALNVPLHDLSLGASHLLYQRATERNHAVRQQSQLGIALTAFQCVLLIALAVIVLRQLRALTERRKRLEALAESLGTARHDAEAANRAKSAFLANMSHEIRTPFHGMLGMMSLLQDGGLSAKQTGYLDTARESAQHLLTILNDILDISQLESGRLQVVPQTIDLLQLVAQVEALMRVQALGKGLALRIDVAPDVPRWVHADPTRLKQILFNLLSNAVKFTSAGRVVLAIAQGKAGLDFSVTDTGIGMDEAMQARVFQRFVQGDDTPSRRASGAGLGLEISRDLARLMGGDITVRSKPGAGSTFTVSLPLASAGAPALASHAIDAPAAGNHRPLRVLVAEDHPVNRAYMEAVLDKLGHRAVFTADGDAAVRAVMAQPAGEAFDIVLMDLHMPGMDGFSAARAIRALPAPRGRVPIVALTADAFQETRRLAQDAGMGGYLTKPAHLPQLRETLERYGGAPLTPPSEPLATATATATASVATSAAHADTLLDHRTVAELQRAFPAAKYAELLGPFVAGRANTVAALRRASAAGSITDLHSQAHALKGASLSLGLKRVGELADQLQSAEPTLTSDARERLIDALEQQFDASSDECVQLGLLQKSIAALTPPVVQSPT
jgi:two-component system, sensor histidine kinase